MEIKPLLGTELKEYFLEHASPYQARPGFYTITKPLHVFKKVKHGVNRDCAIANLIILVGEHVYVGAGTFNKKYSHLQRKMRCSKATVHSIVVSRGVHQGKSVGSAVSDWDHRFKYRVGRNARPDQFSFRPLRCDGGIHFFLNVQDALDY